MKDIWKYGSTQENHMRKWPVNVHIKEDILTTNKATKQQWKPEVLQQHTVSSGFWIADIWV